jgi:predicted nucleotidyltransferase
VKLTLPNLEKDRKDIDWLWPRTLFLTAHGSHAYGTNLPTSDRDYKGFCVAPKQYLLGFAKRFEQAEFKGDPDMVVYGIQKFFKLAADCNPSIIEVLFTDTADHQIVHPLAIPILQKRDLFISKKAKFTFSGYAISQLKKIKTHYKWISNPPKAPPTREEFGLPERTVIPADQLKAAESMIRKQVERWNVPIDELDDAARIAVQERFIEALALIETGYRAQLVADLEGEAERILKATNGSMMGLAGSTAMRDAASLVRLAGPANLERISGQLLGFSDNFLELLDQERRYKGRMDEWRSYQTWLETRNEKRSELERQWGYDTKHGMHLVRLMRMGVEIMEGKGVLVKRPDAEELLAIRNGLWKYEELLNWAESQEKKLDELYQTGKLPKSPPVMELDKLLVETVESIG